jgi:hypothetical protein
MIHGTLTNYFDGRWIVTPDQSKGCSCFLDDLPPGFTGTRLMFNVEPTLWGAWRAIDAKAEE